MTRRDFAKTGVLVALAGLFPKNKVFEFHCFSRNDEPCRLYEDGVERFGIEGLATDRDVKINDDGTAEYGKSYMILHSYHRISNLPDGTLKIDCDAGERYETLNGCGEIIETAVGYIHRFVVI
jgi:hypothetical protein